MVSHINYLLCCLTSTFSDRTFLVQQATLKATKRALGCVGTRTWDTLYASKTDCIQAAKTSRLLQYDPKTDEVKVLARNFLYPNGIATDQDEKWVLFGETFTLRVQKYDLKEASLIAVVVDRGLTGYPDGLDCVWKGVTAKSSLCYHAAQCPRLSSRY
jgi:hypothetical protein